jgi:hypothetical protein
VIQLPMLGLELKDMHLEGSNVLEWH